MTATAASVANTANVEAAPRRAITRSRSIDTELRASREHARRLTALYGPCTPATAAAWDAVEEILAMKANQRVERLTAFQIYCQENPSAPEARIYDV